MKIVIATPVYPPEIGGPATYTVELVNRIKNKHNIIIVTFADNPIILDRIKFLYTSKKRPLPIRLLLFFLKLLFASRSADVIYVQNAMAAGLPAMLVSKLLRKPLVLKFVGDEAWERATQQKITTKELGEFLQNPDKNLKIKIMMIIQGIVLRNSDIITTPSLYLGEELKRAYKIKNNSFKVNYNAMDDDENNEVYDASVKIKKIKNQIMTTARLVVWKGIDGVIKAVSILKNKIPNIKLVVAGDGPEMDNLKKLVNDLNVSENVKLLGRVTRIETFKLRKESEIYVLNSTYEGLPHTVLTSFSSKIPVIATDIPGTNEVVYHKKTGLLVPPRNAEKLAEEIELLLKDKDLQKILTQNAEKLLKEKFSWEKHIETLMGFFTSVVSNPNN
ncbi:glycosyltransferase family 4 protein [Patescibacteria group bacterium]|nr:glycosyltransferase family 4 protein [Patescibacteria group bacterium]MBU4057746.1 glycosyltransferase family 4 protein [Patescibacteria group bacterium]MBU4115794.1 glycosyltransferase family 4 protein [Patescibacteria group bacterium]